MKKSIIYLPAAILWLAISTFLLTLPGEKFPTQSWFDKIWLDKWVHIGIFAVLVFLWCTAATKWSNRSKTVTSLFILISVLAFGYGIAMEFVQKNFIENRSFDSGDIIADGIGALIGLIYSRKTLIKK